VNKKVSVIILSALTILSGFLREYLFGNINWIYLTLTKGRMNQARDEFQFLMEWSASDIIILKWILTGVFFLLFAFLTFLVIKIQFENKAYSKATIVLFSGILLASGFFYLIGILFSVQGNVYGIFRTLMGLGQSFMPLMFLFVLFKFFPKSKID
jgi:hypothetical protein